MATGLAIMLIAVALTYWRPLRRVRTALGVNHLVATGHAFLVLGFLLGLAFGEHPAPFTSNLDPIVALVAGWVGFATGMHFDLRVLRTIPRSAHAVALLPAVVTAVVVGVLGGALLLAIDIDPTQALAATLVLAAAAASSGPTLAGAIRARRPGRSSQARPVLRLIEFSAGVSDVIVIVLAMLAFAMFRAEAEPLAPIGLIAAATGGGALLGGLTWLFLGGRATEDERLLLGLGMLAFTAGFAGWLRLSPAAVAAISAIVLVNLPGQRMARFVEAVRRVERPAVVILMAVIGFHITGPVSWLFFPLVAGMTIVRLACKRWSGDLVAGVGGTPSLAAKRGWGNGLAPQGTLGLMVALSFFHVWGDELSRTLLAAVAVASVINEIIAPWLFLLMLKKITGARSAEARAGRGAP